MNAEERKRRKYTADAFCVSLRSEWWNACNSDYLEFRQWICTFRLWLDHHSNEYKKKTDTNTQHAQGWNKVFCLCVFAYVKFTLDLNLWINLFARADIEIIQLSGLKTHIMNCELHIATQNSNRLHKIHLFESFVWYYVCVFCKVIVIIVSVRQPFIFIRPYLHYNTSM